MEKDKSSEIIATAVDNFEIDKSSVSSTSRLLLEGSYRSCLDVSCRALAGGAEQHRQNSNDPSRLQEKQHETIMMRTEDDDNVGNNDLSVRNLEESCKTATTDATKSSSSSHYGMKHPPLLRRHRNGSDFYITNNDEPDDDQQQENLLRTTFENELNSLHSSTQHAVQIAYMEQEYISNDIITMQSRISYLERRIHLAKEELIAKGGEDMNDKLLVRLNSLGDEQRVDSVDDAIMKNVDTEEKDDEDSGDDENEESNRSTFEVTYESFQPRASSLSRAGSSRPAHRRGSLQNSLHSENSHETHESSAVSGTSSIFRISLLGVDAMPSRWRTRELERERSEVEQAAKKMEEEEAAAAKGDGFVNIGINAATGDSNKSGSILVANHTKEQLLNTLQQLVNERELEISHLENETMIIEKEKSSLENEVSLIMSNMDKAQSSTRNEKEKLAGVLDLCHLDNHRLEKELLETRISLNEKEMNIELLSNELRKARNTFLGIQKRKGKKEKKNKRMTREQRESKFEYEPIPKQSTTTKVVRYEVPTNVMEAYQDTTKLLLQDRDADTKNESSLSSSGNNSESALSLMSSLTLDTSCYLDVLEETNQSR